MVIRASFEAERTELRCHRCRCLLGRKLAPPENPLLVLEFRCPACGERVLWPPVLPRPQ